MSTLHRAPTSHLTAREREILAYVVRGLSNAGIAGALVLSERTVEAHLTSIFDKLDIPRDEQVNRRVRAAIISLSPELATGAV